MAKRRPTSPEEVLAHFEAMGAVQKTSPAYQLDPAGCRDGSFTFEEARLWEPNQEDILEEKFDGLRYLLQVQPRFVRSVHSKNYLTSRRVSVQTGEYVEKQDRVPFIRDWQASARLADSIFDGEVFSRGLSSDTQHDMVTGDVVYKCWDLLRLNGRWLVNLPWEKRQSMLKSALQTAAQPWLHHVQWGVNAPAMLAEIELRGGEGLIRKKRNLPYGIGWSKVKKSETWDVVVTGFEMSTEGKYAKEGWIKGIKFGQYAKGRGGVLIMRDCGQTSGLTEKMRAEITAFRGKMIGRVMEVEAQLRLPSGKLRHPRYLRWRDDKNAKDCVFVAAKPAGAGVPSEE